MVVRKQYRVVWTVIAVIAILGVGWTLKDALFAARPDVQPNGPGLPQGSPAAQKPEAELTIAEKIVLGAREEVNRGVRYDASYQRIPYPMGDVDAKVGACTDVVIRALRRAGYDLQQLIHEDIRARLNVYAGATGLTKADTNIDHRRIPNQMVFLKKYGLELPKEYNDATKDTWQAGDIVYWRMPWEMNHTGILSDRRNEDGVPLVIHNAYMAVEEDALLAWKITGHYRFPAQ